MKIEREKESLKEMVARVQSEKERLQEQNRERVNDYELRLKKAESEKLRIEQETQKQAREKDVIIESLRNQVSILGQNSQ